MRFLYVPVPPLADLSHFGYGPERRLPVPFFFNLLLQLLLETILLGQGYALDLRF